MNALMSSIVIPGLVPGIHVFATLWFQDVDGRNKCGHDVVRDSRTSLRVVMAGLVPAIHVFEC